jgi:hypothetical protein
MSETNPLAQLYAKNIMMTIVAIFYMATLFHRDLHISSLMPTIAHFQLH